MFTDLFHLHEHPIHLSREHYDPGVDARLPRRLQVAQPLEPLTTLICTEFTDPLPASLVGVWWDP